MRSVSPCSGCEPRTLAVLRVVRGGRVASEGFVETLLLDADFDAGTLLLQYHRGARVAFAPAAVQRLGELGQSQIGDAHRHVEVAAELGGERHVLVRET